MVHDVGDVHNESDQNRQVAPRKHYIQNGDMESAAVRRLKELIAANDSPPPASLASASSQVQQSKFALPSPSPYVQRFQPLLATPNVTATLASSRRPSPQLPTPPAPVSEAAQTVLSSTKSTILSEFDTTLLMLRMQRLELEAESRVRLMDPPSPTRNLSSSGSHRGSSNSLGNSPHNYQDATPQQQATAASMHDYHRLESFAARAELAARRVEEGTSQCRLILQQVPSNPSPTISRNFFS
jgi:hypothetical protein